MTETLIDAHELEIFLQRLGQCFRHPATLYLVGGSSLLLAAGKTSTFDIDLQFTIDDRRHAEFIFEHPEILDGIPDKAVLVLLDADDPEFNRANIDLAEATPLPAGSQRVQVRMKKEVRTVHQVHWEAEVQAPQFA